jgi:hypothetical protein
VLRAGLLGPRLPGPGNIRRMLAPLNTEGGTPSTVMTEAMG